MIFFYYFIVTVKDIKELRIFINLLRPFRKEDFEISLMITLFSSLLSLHYIMSRDRDKSNSSPIKRESRDIKRCSQTEEIIV